MKSLLREAIKTMNAYNAVCQDIQDRFTLPFEPNGLFWLNRCLWAAIFNAHAELSKGKAAE